MMNKLLLAAGFAIVLASPASASILSSEGMSKGAPPGIEIIKEFDKKGKKAGKT